MNYTRYAIVTMEIQARNARDADDKAQTLLDKRVVGESFGDETNDSGVVESAELINKRELDAAYIARSRTVKRRIGRSW